MIKLYEHPFSPYVQKVKISLYEKNIPFVTEIPVAFSGAATDFGKDNPRLEVPTLIDDGFPIFDSTVILEYLEDKWPKPPMLPASPRERARVRMIEDLCDTYYEAINWGLMEVQAWKRVTGDTAAAMTKRAEAQTAGMYQRLERELGANAYFNGADFGWGDLSVLPYLNGSVVWGFGPKQGSKLASWLERVSQRESVKKTLEAARAFQGNFDALSEMLASGQFKRQYRDHRLEWMIRSGGVEVVIEGMRTGTIRFSEEIS
jgi:glutathione S-transferase/RNA polymerase-associated protein